MSGGARLSSSMASSSLKLQTDTVGDKNVLPRSLVCGTTRAISAVAELLVLNFLYDYTTHRQN